MNMMLLFVVMLLWLRSFFLCLLRFIACVIALLLLRAGESESPPGGQADFFGRDIDIVELKFRVRD